MSEWRRLGEHVNADGTRREVRMSPTGIVVVEDHLLFTGEQHIRHTRVTVDGQHVQAFASSPQKA